MCAYGSKPPRFYVMPDLNSRLEANETEALERSKNIIRNRGYLGGNLGLPINVETDETASVPWESDPRETGEKLLSVR